MVTKSCLTLATPWTVACQALLSMGFPKQEYWSGLPFSFSRQTCHSSFKTQLNASSSKQPSLPPSGRTAPPPGPVFPNTHLILSWAQHIVGAQYSLQPGCSNSWPLATPPPTSCQPARWFLIGSLFLGGSSRVLLSSLLEGAWADLPP